MTEKRRYFRINETVGLSYEFIDRDTSSKKKDTPPPSVLEIVSRQDVLIERLLREAATESPKVAELIRAFNQKLERVVSQLVLDNQLVGRIANRVKEVNISACGLGFINEVAVVPGEKLKLELELFPSNYQVKAKGIVIGCDRVQDGYFWRVDFYDLSSGAQEALIQHIVQRQSAQLKAARGKPPGLL